MLLIGIGEIALLRVILQRLIAVVRGAVGSVIVTVVVVLVVVGVRIRFRMGTAAITVGVGISLEVIHQALDQQLLPARRH